MYKKLTLSQTKALLELKEPSHMLTARPSLRAAFEKLEGNLFALQVHNRKRVKRKGVQLGENDRP